MVQSIDNDLHGWNIGEFFFLFMQCPWLTVSCYFALTCAAVFFSLSSFCGQDKGTDRKLRQDLQKYASQSEDDKVSCQIACHRPKSSSAR